MYGSLACHRHVIQVTYINMAHAHHVIDGYILYKIQHTSCIVFKVSCILYDLSMSVNHPIAGSPFLRKLLLCKPAVSAWWDQIIIFIISRCFVPMNWKVPSGRRLCFSWIRRLKQCGFWYIRKTSRELRIWNLIYRNAILTKYWIK